MHNCPHCSTATISNWRKFSSTYARPTRCPACGGLSYTSVWSQLGFNLALQMLFPAVIVVALMLQSWFALLLLPLGLYGLYYWMISFCTLLTTDQASADKARKRSDIALAILILMVIATSIMWS